MAIRIGIIGTGNMGADHAATAQELQTWVDHLGGAPAGPLAGAADGLRASLVADAVIASMHAGGMPTAVASWAGSESGVACV